MAKKEKYDFGEGVWASYHARSKNPKLRAKARKMLKEMMGKCIEQEVKKLKKLEKRILREE